MTDLKKPGLIMLALSFAGSAVHPAPAQEIQTVQLADVELTLEGDPGSFSLGMETREVEPGLELARISLESDEAE